MSHDGRGVCRVFRMTFGDGRWTLERDDPDFHQRFIATVEGDRIEGRWEASEDGGGTWRKDFDLVFERRRTRSWPLHPGTVDSGVIGPDPRPQ